MRRRSPRPGAVSSIAARQYESGLWRAKIEALHSRPDAQRQAGGGRRAALLHVFNTDGGRHDLLFARLYRALPCRGRSEEHTSELQSRPHLVCRLLLEKKKKNQSRYW